MGDGTGISWTDATWNPIRGCRRTAPAGSKQSGCGDPSGGGCYAERQAARFAGPGQAYEGLITLTANGPRWSGQTKFVGEHLADPLRWKKPRRIFVDSMSDLFYDGFSDEQIAAVYGVMLLAAQHTYQVLTKRPARMREFFKKWSVDACLEVLARTDTPVGAVPGAREWNRPPRPEWFNVETWPVPWIWHGTSVENQAAADERIPELLATASHVRFLSIEPMLGPVDLTDRLGMWTSCPECGRDVTIDEDGCCVTCGDDAYHFGVDWIIAGCESGPGARACEVDWLRAVRDQCAAAKVPLFLKQAERTFATDQSVRFGDGSKLKGGGVVELPYLDGAQWAQFPEVK